METAPLIAPDLVRLRTIGVEKPWGMTRLPAPFTQAGTGRIGEIWFDPPAHCPLLAKFIFTGERLSIQVHPGDDEAKARGHAAGKEECWYILDAEPDARLGIGTVRPLGPGELRNAALSGAIERLIAWHPVERGMFFHIPPGTIHAIGSGIVLAELQQKSDITYRLYDYGRPRALHLDDAVAVARPVPMPASLRKSVDPAASALLLDEPRLSVAHISGGDLAPIGNAGPLLILPIDGEIKVGGLAVAPGECLWGADASMIEAADNCRFLAGWQRGAGR